MLCRVCVAHQWSFKGQVMRAVIQRVSQANVDVGGETIGRIGRGLLVYLGVGQGDAEKDAEFMAEKLVNLRIFADEA
ncbi:MAG: D-aminoacyl-tRNA deacylase, partial [Sedimentisphaerales bacterium]|nr:D-aminoacyl-tRNA deacylase [Sedimentisphaerales bacterium]